MYVEHTLCEDIHINSNQHTRRHTYIHSRHTCKASNRTQRSCNHIFSTANCMCGYTVWNVWITAWQLLQVVMFVCKLYMEL